MKRLLSLLAFLLLAASPPAGAEEIAAFFTKVNAYAYPGGPSAGRRVLVRPRQAFSVVNLTTDREEKLWLQIIYPAQTRKVEGSGWTPLTPHEILSAGGTPVDVFAEILVEDTARVKTVKVPASGLKLLNVTHPSERFPQVTWQKVSYTTRKPLRPWIRASAGILRPGKTSEFLSRVYVEMVSRNLAKEKLNRLLAGVVRVGDDTWEVARALGKPLRVQEESSTKAKRTVWQYPSLVVRFQGEVVERIN